MEEVHYLLAFVETTQILPLYPPPSPHPQDRLRHTVDSFSTERSLWLEQGFYRLMNEVVVGRSCLESSRCHLLSSIKDHPAIFQNNSSSRLNQDKVEDMF